MAGWAEQGGDPPAQKIDFGELAGALLDRAESLVPMWLPGGSKRGHEWVCGGLSGGAGHSCSVNLVNGRWGDFAGDDAGGDLLSLYAAIRGLKQGQAARELQADMGWQAPVPVADPSKPKKRRSMWRALDVVPEHAPSALTEWSYKDDTQGAWVKLQAVRSWAYWFEGELWGHVSRFERINSKGVLVKDTLPLTWCVDESDDRGTCAWRWKMWEGTRPLYVPAGRLTPDGSLPVVVVEGEKCAEALHQLLGNDFDVVSWPGGVNGWPKANWKWLRARHVVLWADTDSKRVKLTKGQVEAGVDAESMPYLPWDQQPGAAAMIGIGELLQREFECKVTMCLTPAPGVVPDGWDVADAIAEGWDADRVRAFIADVGPAFGAAVVAEPAPSSSDAPPWVDADVPLDELVAGESSSPPPSPGEAPALPQRGEGAPKKKRSKKPAADDAGSDDERPDWFWPRVDMLTERFSLIYASDTAWDGRQQMIVRVPTMRLAFGSEPTKFWLSRVAAGTARTVLPTDLVFEPGQQVPEHQINMFGGLVLDETPCDAADVAPMLNLLRHLCSETSTSADDVDAVMNWVLCWQALPLQQLGVKMQTACVFHGAQGTGKNLYWDAWRDLFGLYGITVGQTELEDKFNGWVSRKLAIIGDEVVSRQEMYHNKNRLKLIVTQEHKFPIRGMLQETRWESNHANVVFLSNESQPLALEERDRRYLVVYTPLEADASLYESVRAFKAAGGMGKWLHYLRTYPLDGFTAHTKPILTKAKVELIELNWKAPERFAHEWLEGFLELPMQVCSAEQLYRAFRRWCDLQGEKWPASQSMFTRQLDRWVNERRQRDAAGRLEQPKLIYKQIALKDAKAVRKTVRCWLPEKTGMKGEWPSEGDWAHDSVSTFEIALGKFCRRPGALGDEA
jgi:hypothetical protein